MRYRAFLSYSRADDRLANWLHRRLDQYRTPSALLREPGLHGAPPARLHPIFRDRTDMAGGGVLADNIRDALMAADALVVLCSPAAARSEWVNREVTAFIEAHGDARVYAVIAKGMPGSGDPQTECLPPALRDRGLLASDFRYIKGRDGRITGDGRDGGLFKLIAGLVGLPLDTLLQRERRRQNVRQWALGLAVLSFASTTAFAFWQAHVAEEANRKWFEAIFELPTQERIDALQSAKDSWDRRVGAMNVLLGGQLAPPQTAQAQPPVDCSNTPSATPTTGPSGGQRSPP